MSAWSSVLLGVEADTSVLLVISNPAAQVVVPMNITAGIARLPETPASTPASGMPPIPIIASAVATALLPAEAAPRPNFSNRLIVVNMPYFGFWSYGYVMCKKVGFGVLP